MRKNVPLEDEVVVHAVHQSEGRGQAAAKWHSEAGKSLCFSMFKDMSPLVIEEQAAINWAVSLGVKKGLEHFGVQQVAVKWPNDILADGRKIGGILIENQWHAGTMTSSIIGVGINVNNTSLPNLPQASSMLLQSGTTFEISEVLFKIVAGISSELKRFVSNDAIELKAEYEAQLFRRNIRSEFEDAEGNRFQGTIKGVSNGGRLIIELSDGVQDYFAIKQLKLSY